LREIIEGFEFEEVRVGFIVGFNLRSVIDRRQRSFVAAWIAAANQEE
jgi:hypothetical protein